MISDVSQISSYHIVLCVLWYVALELDINWIFSCYSCSPALRAGSQLDVCEQLGLVRSLSKIHKTDDIISRTIFTYPQSFIPVGPRTSKIQIFDPFTPMTLTFGPSRTIFRTHAQAVGSLLIPTNFHPNRTKDLEDTDIWPLTPMTLNFGPTQTLFRIR